MNRSFRTGEFKLKGSDLKEMNRAVDEGRSVAPETALEMLRSGPDDIHEIFACASRMRLRFFGGNLRLCSILNAKSGACSEDCSFCAQSAHHRTNAVSSDLMHAEEIVRAYEESASLPIEHFGVVASGRALRDREIEQVCEAAESRRIPGVEWCASMGCLDKEKLLRLKNAGFKRFHHNLESAETFFPSVCSTHDYSLRLDTVRTAKEAGLEVCCGGILGLGESIEQRVEFATILSREAVDCIPLNFLIPIPGTRLGHMEPIKPLDMLRSIAVFRMINPGAEIKIAAGRVHMRDLQSMIFLAGATGMMIGSLLTVAGREVERDIQMLRDLQVGLQLD
jgi:biotin synthase